MNRLKDETSPYLLQHSENPVDWRPWGRTAFEAARKTDRPVFLSIGYSTCHWCHVMEKESFEDEEVARLLNDTFICIKVDREERPDIDKLYMDIAQLMTGRGGWPLSICMTPEKKPFFAATYIPREDRYGQAGLLTLIPRIAGLWKEKKDDITGSAAAILEKMSEAGEDAGGDIPDAGILDEAYRGYLKAYDPQFGGMGNAPKFPSTHNLSFLLHHWYRTGDNNALDMVTNTLDHMRMGGIWDHVGYGFHRYSTDRQWRVPHFEKMLYDQAIISMTYLDVYQATRKRYYRETVNDIFKYVGRELSAKGGGFYSAEDADSEGAEGKYYLWTKEEIESVLDLEDAAYFISAFNIKSRGNYRDEASGRPTGKNIPYMKITQRELSKKDNGDISITSKRIERILSRLRKTRVKRIRPFRDEKILTDWNALMSTAFARGGRILENKKYLDKAAGTVDFLLQNMETGDGRLFHSRSQGVSAIDANLDDYAFMIMALIELYQSTFDYKYIKKALEYEEVLDRYFWDKENGGYYFTPSDNKDLILRKKESYDGAIPSGNSISFLNLLKLGRITMDKKIEEKASRLIKAFSNTIKQNPNAHAQFLMGVDFLLGDSYEIILVEGSDKNTIKDMLGTLETEYIPNKVVIMREDRADAPEFLKNLKMVNGMTTAYVCKNYYCELPVTSPSQMMELITDNPRG